MPNWCWNNLEVHGDEIQLREFVEKSLVSPEENEIHDRTGFSFNGTYPMHEDLNITSGTQTQDEKEQAIINKAKYGYENWYDWRCDEWGTKWDACEPNIQHNNIDYFAVSFETAWAPPIAWIQNIMKDYPGLQFTLEYDEPGMCFGGRLFAQHEKVFEDNHWELDPASECCEAEVSFDDYDDVAKCLVCGEETETISINVADIKPAKIKVNENK